MQAGDKDINFKEIYDRLKKLYPEARSGLKFETPFQLLIATILSSQCTDTTVNKITKELFVAAATPEEFLELGKERLKEYIRSAGLYENKSKNIINTCEILVERFDGKVPSSREKLESLPGVGRKTANVVLSNAFNIPAIAVDTHVFRVARRLGVARGSQVEKVEKELMQKIPQNLWGIFHHLLISHGRNTCKAKNPDCANCQLGDLCDSKSEKHDL